MLPTDANREFTVPPICHGGSPCAIAHVEPQSPVIPSVVEDLADVTFQLSHRHPCTSLAPVGMTLTGARSRPLVHGRLSLRSKQRVLLGMSGGVDSSVAGYLLREQGYDVVGVTMKVWPQDCISRAEDKCCGPQAIADARSGRTRSVFHIMWAMRRTSSNVVINYFSSEYQAGRTPNPCVMCNEKLKIGILWAKGEALGVRLHRDRALRDHRQSFPPRQRPRL